MDEVARSIRVGSTSPGPATVRRPGSASGAGASARPDARLAAAPLRRHTRGSAQAPQGAVRRVAAGSAHSMRGTSLHSRSSS
jgi:hypothetical protein